VPNPESALNEEAGKLLLDHYEIYSSRARLYTDIHAKPLAYVLYLYSLYCNKRTNVSFIDKVMFNSWQLFPFLL
jgi:hypothetical protein